MEMDRAMDEGPMCSKKCIDSMMVIKEWNLAGVRKGWKGRQID